MAVGRTLWNQRIQMRDGVCLAADVMLPLGDGPFPTVVTRTPYLRKPGAWMQPLVDAGYAYVVVDMRGRGDSDGEFRPLVRDDEDGYDSIEWIAAQEWSTGRVGMVGVSYEGMTQWWTAATHPPHLRCIAPMAIGVARSGPRRGFDTGVPHIYWGWWLHGVSGRTQQHPGAPSWEAAIDHLPLRTLHERVGAATRWWPAFANDDIDYLSEDCALTDEDWAELDIPVLIGVGWWDDQTTLTSWRRVRESPGGENARLLVGAWDHGGNKAPKPMLGGLDVSASAIDTVAHVERFLARHLKDEDAPDAEIGRCRVYRTGADRWEDLGDWPSAPTTPSSFYLTSDGDARTLHGDGRLAVAASEPGADRYRFDPADPGRDFTNLDLFAWSDPPLDQRTMLRRSDILVYRGTELGADLDVSGEAVFEGFVSLDAPDADIRVILMDEHPDGRRILLGGELGVPGLVRLSLRNGAVPELLAPDDIAKVRVPLTSLHHRFHAGHRLCIALTSSAFPAFARNLNTGRPWADDVDGRPAEVTVHHGLRHPSRLILPVETTEAAR